MTKLALAILFLGAFALTVICPAQSFCAADSTKSNNKAPLMPAHGGGKMPSGHPSMGGHPDMSGHGDQMQMPMPVAGDALPDSLRYQDGPFDSTLLTASFVIETKHRLYPSFHQIDTVIFGQPFALGDDDEYTAKVSRFNPHLAITTKGEFKKISDTLYNPAVRVQVFQADSLVQESWAFFYTDAPHFRGNHYFGFKLAEFKVNELKYVAPPKQQ